jgi:hypothetical protein
MSFSVFTSARAMIVASEKAREAEYQASLAAAQALYRERTLKNASEIAAEFTRCAEHLTLKKEYKDEAGSCSLRYGSFARASFVPGVAVAPILNDMKLPFKFSCDYEGCETMFE